MQSYWWQCTQCGTSRTFAEECATRGVVHFLWDVLLPAEWDQSLLVRTCAVCQSHSLRITYEFPRAEKETMRTLHIVGIPQDTYLPMLWETSPDPDLRERWFDFKYVQGRSVWGLNKPAVLTNVALTRLIDLYRVKANCPIFLRG